MIVKFSIKNVLPSSKINSVLIEVMDNYNNNNIINEVGDLAHLERFHRILVARFPYVYNPFTGYKMSASRVCFDNSDRLITRIICHCESGTPIIINYSRDIGVTMKFFALYPQRFQSERFCLRVNVRHNILFSKILKPDFRRFHWVHMIIRILLNLMSEYDSS